jgi:hypothetical protein
MGTILTEFLGVNTWRNLDQPSSIAVFIKEVFDVPYSWNTIETLGANSEEAVAVALCARGVVFGHAKQKMKLCF